MNIPFGFCHCGCGEQTNIATHNNAKYKAIKGQPNRFKNRHASRKSPIEWMEEDRGYSTPCHIWQRGKTDAGYGKRKISGKTYLVHRLRYIERFGEPDEGMHLDHLCRQKDCTNPEHLEPVSPAVNKQRGEGVKITMEDARTIRWLSAEGLRNKYIAAIYGLHPRYVSLVVSGRRWKEPV